MRSDLRHYLEQHGTSCLAFSGLEEGLEHHVVDGLGYIAYARRDWPIPVTIALGEPVAAQENKAALLDSFLNAHPQACFVQLRQESAELLARRGYRVNMMGREMRIELPQFSLRGPRMQELRSALRRASAAGLEVRELRVEPAVAEQMREVSRRWMAGRTLRDREYAFLSRRARFADEPGVRKFAVLREGRIAAFAFFDPIYRDGRIFGYAASVLRGLRQRELSLQDLVVLKALECFRAEGAAVLNLGLMPFHALDDVSGLRPSVLTRALFGLLYRYGSPLVNSVGISFHKQRYCGVQLPVYFASRSALPLGQLYMCSRISGLNPVRQLIGASLRAVPRFAAQIASGLLHA